MERLRYNPRLREALIDYGIPMLLLVPALLMLWVSPRLMASGAVPRPIGVGGSPGVYATGATYLFVTAIFVPLVVRRKYPLAVLGLTTVLAGLFALLPNPPAPTQLAPLLALYTVGTLRDRRTVWICYALVTVFTTAMVVRPFTGISWIADAVSTATSFGVAAALGDAARSRRAYVAAVEQRAIDAERTREDEARRRVEEERLRIARELHDVTAHSLSIIALQAGAAEKAVRATPTRPSLRCTPSASRARTRSTSCARCSACCVAPMRTRRCRRPGASSACPSSWPRSSRLGSM